MRIIVKSCVLPKEQLSAVNISPLHPQARLACALCYVLHSDDMACRPVHCNTAIFNSVLLSVFIIVKDVPEYG